MGEDRSSKRCFSVGALSGAEGGLPGVVEEVDAGRQTHGRGEGGLEEGPARQVRPHRR